jgi:hypothetical protein
MRYGCDNIYFIYTFDDIILCKCKRLRLLGMMKFFESNDSGANKRRKMHGGFSLCYIVLIIIFFTLEDGHAMS